jgi:hypothetical protein
MRRLLKLGETGGFHRHKIVYSTRHAARPESHNLFNCSDEQMNRMGRAPGVQPGGRVRFYDDPWQWASGVRQTVRDIKKPARMDPVGVERRGFKVYRSSRFHSNVSADSGCALRVPRSRVGGAEAGIWNNFPRADGVADFGGYGVRLTGKGLNFVKTWKEGNQAAAANAAGGREPRVHE